NRYVPYLIIKYLTPIKLGTHPILFLLRTGHVGGIVFSCTAAFRESTMSLLPSSASTVAIDASSPGHAGPEIRGTAPLAQGLYSPHNEHDACGVGFVAHIKGRKSHAIIQ